MTAAQSASALEIVERFNERFNAHDIDGFMSLMTTDCVFENTFPAPDGERYSGQDEVRDFWDTFFRANPTAHFEAEDVFATDDRCTVRWRYTWHEADGIAGHVRGVDVFRIREGLIAEKLAYVKG